MLPLTEEEIEALFPALKAVFYAAGSVQAFARPFLSRGVSVVQRLGRQRASPWPNMPLPRSSWG